MKDQKVNQILKEINELLTVKFEDLQTFKMLWSEWQLGEKKAVGNTSSHLILKTKNHLRFFVEIPPLEVFPVHWHNCTEVCKVMSGILSDKEDDSIKYSEGQEYIINPFRKHRPCNLSKDESLFLQVDFYK